MVSIIKSIIPAGRPNRPGRSVSLQKITIHNTANTTKGADAEAHSRYLIKTNEKKSWHFTCDDTDTYQHLPTNEIGYHAKSGNSKSLGIEICENQGIDHKIANDKAASLTAELLHLHNLSLSDVVTHKHWTGKTCPRLLLDGSNEGKKWQLFLNRVKHFYELKDGARFESIFASSAKNLEPATAADDLIDLDHSTVILG